MNINRYIKEQQQDKTVLVSDLIVKNFNTTAAMIYGHIVFNIIKHGSYHYAPSSAARYLNMSKTTVIKYEKIFEELGLFKNKTTKNKDFLTESSNIDGISTLSELEIEIEALNGLKNPFKRRVLILPENDEIKQVKLKSHIRNKKNDENNLYQNLIINYYSAINGTSKTDKDQSIVQLNISKIKYKNVSSSKAHEYERTYSFVKSFLRDKFVNAKLKAVNNKAGEAKFHAYYSSMANQFGLCSKTVKKLITSLVEKNVIHSKRENGVLVLQMAHLIKDEVQQKFSRLSKILRERLKPSKNKKNSFNNSSPSPG